MPRHFTPIFAAEAELNSDYSTESIQPSSSCSSFGGCFGAQMEKYGIIWNRWMEYILEIHLMLKTLIFPMYQNPSENVKSQRGKGQN